MDRIRRWEKPVRFAAAVLLVAAFLFPLARCSQQDPRTPQTSPPTYKYYYAWTDFDAGSFWSWAILAAFFWPFPLLLLEGALARPRPGPVLLLLQPLLVLLSAYAVFHETAVKELWIGGYLAYGALALYFLASLALPARLLIERRRAKKGVPPP